MGAGSSAWAEGAPGAIKATSSKPVTGRNARLLSRSGIFEVAQ
jgi:hypothetical protein